MKKVFIFIMALFALACNDKKGHSNATSQEVSIYGTPVTALASEALQHVKQRFAGLKTKSADSKLNTKILNVFKELDHYTLTQCPYYKLNIEAFYNNPSPETLLSCLFVSEDEVYYIGERDGKVEFNLVLTKKGSEWESELGEHWDKVIGWLPAKLEEAGSKDFKIFRVYWQEYVTYNQNEKPVFHRITGEEIAPPQTM